MDTMLTGTVVCGTCAHSCESMTSTENLSRVKNQTWGIWSQAPGTRIAQWESTFASSNVADLEPTFGFEDPNFSLCLPGAGIRALETSSPSVLDPDLVVESKAFSDDM